MGEEYVYVNSTFGLWRLRFEGKELEGPVQRDKGEVTQLCSYHDNGVPLGAGIIRWKSKVFFVGGEKRIPNDNPGEGHRKPPSLYFLNRRVYVCEDQDQDWAAAKPSVHIRASDTIPPCAGPKPIPFAVPLKDGPKTLFCVIGQSPLVYDYHLPPGPDFEIFDPESESWRPTPEQPLSRDMLGAFSVFEFGGRIFLIGKVEISFSLESNKWERTDYFVGRSVGCPLATVAVDGLSDDIRIGIANRDGMVYAYKLLDCNENDKGCRVALQELPEVDPYCTDLFPLDIPIELSLSSLGNGMVLFMSSSFYEGRYSEDPLVHYYCLKLHFTQLPRGEATKRAKLNSQPFVKVRVLDCCTGTVQMSDKDMRKVALHIGMRSAFLL